MLRYIAKDYLADALHHRRSQVERMMVVQPHHIEFVNQYVHKGSLPGMKDHFSPWSILERLPDLHHLPYGSVSHSDSSIEGDLSALVQKTTLPPADNGRGGGGGGGREVESYHDDADGSDVDFLSQEIDDAMERLMPSSSMDDSSRSSCDVDNEKFIPAKLLSNTLQVDEGCGKGLLEDLESPLHLEGLLELMPTVEDLAARLKPKMIHDPFLDASGEPYTYNKLCSSDYLLVFHDDGLESKTEDISPTTLQQMDPCHESFQQDDLVQDEVDPLMEMVVVELEEPLILEHVIDESDIPIVLSSESELDKSTNQQAASSDLKKLIDHYGNGESGGLQGLEIAPRFTSPDTGKPMEFVDLNNQGIENDSNDSGIGNALLESPYIPPHSSPLTSSTPLLEYQLSKLNPMPLTPEKELPIAKKKQLKEVWEKEKMFDTVLALTLPCPDISDTSRALVVEDVIKQLEIQPLKFDGYNEFELSWDPLEYSHKEMGTACKSLISCEPTFNTDSPPEKHSNIWSEVFTSDACTNEENGRDELSLSPVVDNGEEVVGTHAKKTDPPLLSDIPSLNLEPTAPAGYLKPLPTTFSSLNSTSRSSRVDPWSLVQRAASGPSHGGTTTFPTKPSWKGSYDNFTLSPQQTCSKADINMEGISQLDAFLMLRSGVANNEVSSRKRPGTPLKTKGNLEGGDKRRAMETRGVNDSMELEIIERRSTPSFQDVCLSDKYLSSLSEMECLVSSLRNQLERYGLHVPIRGTGPREMSVDSLNFFFKQQQKALEDSQNEGEAGDALRNCQLAASLYLTGSVMDTLMHCSFKASLSRFSSLCEKYSGFLNDSIFPLKSALVRLESGSGEIHPHPKLLELARVVSRWKRTSRKSCRDKAVVVVETEFSALSGEILDFLQSVPGLESCVFSFTSDETSNELYKKAVEERFHHYDCLVVPTTSLSNHSNFLWERVSLVVEYQPLKRPLFDGGLPSTNRSGGQINEEQPGVCSVSDRLHFQEYIALRTVLDLSTSNISFSNSLAGERMAYTVVTSENVTSNSQLLQLLETRYNVLVVERNYRTLAPSKWLNWADLCISQGAGILLRPLSVLGSDASGRSLIHILMGLSLQYHTCWVILYQESQDSYELGGGAPCQLSLLHAAVAPLHAHYSVRILMASSLPHAARLIRRIIEETHKEAKDDDEWDDGSWLSEEFSEREKYLLLFPCIHSFNAQFMLQKFTLGGLLAADIAVLLENLPGVPEKAIKLFYRMTHASTIAATGFSSVSPSLPSSANVAPMCEEIHSNPEQTLLLSHSPNPMDNGCYADELSAHDLSMSKPPSLIELERPCHHITSIQGTDSGTIMDIPVWEDVSMLPEYIPHHIPSSPIPGLNDSLENIETNSALCGEPLLTESTGNVVGKDLNTSWTQMMGEGFQFTSRERDSGDASSSFHQSFQPRTKEHGIDLHLPYHHDPSASSAPDIAHREKPQISSHPVPDAFNISLDKSLGVGLLSDRDYFNSQLLHRYSDHTMNSDRSTSIYNSSLPMCVTSSSLASESQHLPKSKTTSTRLLSSSKSQRLKEAESLTSYQLRSTSFPCHHTSFSSSTALFGKDYLIPRSSRAIASSVVRKPLKHTLIERTPVKALDLGLDSERERRLRLESNDRNLVSSQMSQLASKGDLLTQAVRNNAELDDSFTGSDVRSKYFVRSGKASFSTVSGNNEKVLLN